MRELKNPKGMLTSFNFTLKTMKGFTQRSNMTKFNILERSFQLKYVKWIRGVKLEIEKNS